MSDTRIYSEDRPSGASSGTDWYHPARAWARILLGDWAVTDAKIDAPLKEDPVNPNHQEIGYRYPFDYEAVRADVARLNAEYARKREANRPTPEGTAKAIRTVFDNVSTLRPIYNSEIMQMALVTALEPIFTSIWANGYDDGQDQLKTDILEVFGDD